MPQRGANQGGGEQIQGSMTNQSQAQRDQRLEAPVFGAGDGACQASELIQVEAETGQPPEVSDERFGGGFQATQSIRPVSRWRRKPFEVAVEFRAHDGAINSKRQCARRKG